MDRRLYVGGLPFGMTDGELKDLFESKCGSGSVVSARIIHDKETGKSRGFGFVEMDSSEKAKEARNLFKNETCGGRPIKVDTAQERSGDRRRGGGNEGY